MSKKSKAIRQYFSKLLFECVAIFIGVLAAFLIDNYRQQKDEFRTELTILAEITNDLKKDSTNFIEERKFIKTLHKSLSKTISILEGKDNQVDSLEDFSLVWIPRIRSNMITYESIKNTGGFKLINDKNLTDGLLKYYDERTYVNTISETEILSTQEKLKEFLIKKTKFSNSTEKVFLVDTKSILDLRGNQELINLCYTKKLSMEGMLSGIDQQAIKLNDLIGRCDEYLRKME